MDLKVEIKNLLKEYSEEVESAVDESVRAVSKKAVKKLKSKKSFAMHSSATGEYAKGWSVDIKTARLGVTATIYNKKYQLPHLLEHGHATRNGTGRFYPATPAYPHIAPVEEEIERDLPEEIIKRVKG